MMLAALKKHIMLLVALSLAVNILHLTIPIFSMQVFDRVMTSRSMDTLTMLVLIALFLLAIQALLDWCRQQITLRIGLGIDHLHNPEVLSIALEKSAELRHPSFESIQQLHQLRNLITSPSFYAIIDLLFIPFFLLIMFLLHPVLGIIALSGTIILCGFALVNLLIQKHSQHEQARLTAGDKAIINRQWLLLSDTVVSMNMNSNLIESWHKHHIDTLVSLGKMNARILSVTSVARFFRSLLQIAVMTASIILIIQSNASTGLLIASSMIMARTLAPIEQAIVLWPTWRKGIQAWQALAGTLDRRNHHSKPKITPKSGQLNIDIKLHRISSKNVLSDIGFSVDSGQTIAVVGDNSSGKTTLVRLIVGLAKPTIGDIRLDGVILNKIDTSFFGYLPQQVSMLNGSIAENISRFNNNGGIGKVIEITEILGIHEKILQLPDGYETQLGENDSPLPCGMMQMIGIARAFYGTPKLIILDEPTSHLDTTGEHALLRALAYAKKNGITVILTTHRPVLLRYSDKIAVLNKGQLSDFDDSDQVINRILDFINRLKEKQGQGSDIVLGVQPL